jgi:hypothetical protein
MLLIRWFATDSDSRLKILKPLPGGDPWQIY